MDYESKPHRDAHNVGASYIVSWGDYVGGELCLENGMVVDTDLKPHLFNGANTTHWNNPIVGHKISLVFFNIEWPHWWTQDKGYPICKVVEIAGKDWLEVEDVDGSLWLFRGSQSQSLRPATHPVDRVGKLTQFGGRSIVYDA